MSLFWIVIAEAVEHLIPKRVKHFDQHGFSEWNPDVLNGEVPAAKVIET
jgi:hypothetical protein